MIKLDDDGRCPQCGQISKKEEVVDFRCSLVIEDGNNDTITEVIIYRRHLKLDIPADGDEENLIEILEDSVIGKHCEIHYNEAADENKFAVKIILT